MVELLSISGNLLTRSLVFLLLFNEHERHPSRGGNGFWENLVNTDFVILHHSLVYEQRKFQLVKVGVS